MFTPHFSSDSAPLLWPRMFLLAFVACWLSGCQTTDSGGGSNGKVVFQGFSEEQIRDATVTVFAEEGFEVEMSARHQTTFGRKGSNWKNLLYGGWPGDAGVWERVRVETIELPGGKLQLTCAAFRVTSRGESFFEEEKALRKSQSKPYDKLLQEVKKRLVPPPAPAK